MSVCPCVRVSAPFFLLYTSYTINSVPSVRPSVRMTVNRVPLCPPVHPPTKGMERMVKIRKGRERSGSERKMLERGRKASNSRTCISFLCGSPCLDMLN